MKQPYKALYILDETDIAMSFNSSTLFLGKESIASSDDHEQNDLDTIAANLGKVLDIPVENINVTAMGLAHSLATALDDLDLFNACSEDKDFEPLLQGYTNEDLARFIPDQS
jgi:hypothetical protein